MVYDLRSDHKNATRSQKSMTFLVESRRDLAKDTGHLIQKLTYKIATNEYVQFPCIFYIKIGFNLVKVSKKYFSCKI